MLISIIAFIIKAFSLLKAGFELLIKHTSEGTITANALGNIEDIDLRNVIHHLMHKKDIIELCVSSDERDDLISKISTMRLPSKYSETEIKNIIDNFVNDLINGISGQEQLNNKYQNRMLRKVDLSLNISKEEKPGLYATFIPMDDIIKELDDAYKSLLSIADDLEKKEDYKSYVNFIENKYLKVRGVDKQPHYPKILNNLAKALMELDENEKPLEYLKVALAKEGGNRQILTNLAIAYANNENYAEALKIIKIVENDQNPHIQVQVLNIKSLVRMYDRKFDEALEFNSDALALEPENIYLNANKGLILCYKGDFSQGIQILEETALKHPEDILVNKTLAFCLLQKQLLNISTASQPFDERTTVYFHTKMTGSKFEFKESAEIQRAVALYEKVISLKLKKDETLIQNLATSYLNNNQYQKAIDLLDELDFERVDKKSQYIILNTKGFANVLLQKYDEAILLFKKMVELEPEQPMPYIYLAQSYAAKSEIELALTNFAKADEIRENDPMIKFNLGILQANKGNFSNSLALFENAISLGMNNDAVLFYNKGRVEFQLAQYSSAAVSFLKAKEHNYEDRISLLKELSFCYFKRSQWHEALDALNEILVLSPNDAEVLLSKAKVLFNLLEYTKSLDILNEIIRINNPLYSSKAHELVRLIIQKTNKIIIIK